MTADVKVDEIFVFAQSFFGRMHGLQDQLSVRQKLDSLRRNCYAFAGSLEQLDSKLLFQGLNLMADCRLADLQRFGGMRKIEMLENR